MLDKNMEKYNWKLEDIFRNSEEFEQSKKKLKELLVNIKNYKGILCDSAENLYNCYSIYEKAIEIFEKIYSYGKLKYNLDMANQESIKMFKGVETLNTEFNVATAFMVPEISYADENKITEFIKERVFEKYRREIQDVLDKKKHILTKEEESLLANYSEIFSTSKNTFDILTNTEFKFGTLINEQGQEVELTSSTYISYLKSSNIEVRKQAFNLMYDKYKEFINTITELYMSNVKVKSVTSKLRKYNSSLEKAVINDDANIKVYNCLIDSVNENISSNYKFLELKKRLLKTENMHMYDLYVNPLKTEKDEITFEETKTEILKALEVLGNEYTNKLKEAFENNWIDVYPKPNKRGGAYSMGVYGVHPFILANFVNSKRNVNTIVHELGHSMHSYYSNNTQGIIDSKHTIMVAEVVGTVNEILLSEYQINNEKDKDKKAELVYELLEEIRATFFRQAMFAEFEKIVHEKNESGLILSADDLNDIYYKLNCKYFGDTIFVDEKIKYEWARIPHFFTDFYVYKYATGISAAIVIATKILNNEEGFTERYINMLKQGCKMKSIDLLKSVDVDLEDKSTYDITIQFYNDKMKELENLII